ncbi:2'-5' RNA ligase family protein [Streptomyces sp. DSM 44917]|uniref:2'-5' RNA ligase family protein n=1 Tax=Streptomyces boetiae TaxID=3075541 RepID=A0ABU2LAD2_9ACTN|nr:2'-5' RNA ligase family protein [Streptomyces sp. DSM 44917]MDT0308168.1 2'-5' RNA ligase family protein [Streptomyces sp. DSM 44917]
MDTVTLGVSIAVPEPHAGRLQRCRLGFGDAAASGILTHVTLLPPTEVEAGALPAVDRHLAAVAAAWRPFPLRLAGTGTFRPVSPVVYLRVAEGGGACDRLQERVRASGGPLARELAFPYHPHVTLAHGLADAALDAAQASLAGYEAAWTVGGFALYELGGDGCWAPRREFAFPPPGPRRRRPRPARHREAARGRT